MDQLVQPHARRLNIWLLAVGEPLPVDGADERLLRVGLLARCLASRGHRVTWWTSAFDHRRKRFRPQSAAFNDGGIEYRLLRGCGYTRNISLRRIRDQRQVAAEFAKLAPKESQPPDVLFVAYPTIELADSAIRFARATGRPAVVDVRDLWPDIFTTALPTALRPLGKLGMWGMKQRSARVLAGAAAITGITQSFVDWGVHRAGRPLRSSDAAFPLAYDYIPIPRADLENARRSLNGRGVGTHEGQLQVAFAGTLGKQFDFQPVFEAADALRHEPVTFVIAGAGESEHSLRQRARSLPNVTLVGWLNRVELGALLETATVGLAPYRSTWDFEASIPNKVIEYLASGLPVLSSLRGETADLLEGENCGITYSTASGESLAAALRELRADPDRVEMMSANARRVFAHRFSGADIYPSMADYLERAAAVTGFGT